MDDNYIRSRINQILEQKIAMGAGSKRRSGSKSRSKSKSGSKKICVKAYKRHCVGSKSKAKRCRVKKYCRGKGMDDDMDYIYGRGVMVGGARKRRRVRRAGVLVGGAQRRSKIRGRGVLVGGSKRAASHNPWLKFLAHYRRMLKRENIDMPAQEILKSASKEYHRM